MARGKTTRKRTRLTVAKLTRKHKSKHLSANIMSVITPVFHSGKQEYYK